MSRYDITNDKWDMRSRRQICVTELGEVVVPWYEDFELGIPKELQDVVGFKNKQPVHLGVELYCDKAQTNFRTHPLRWTMLPSVGRNPELEKLNSMGLKLEWVDEKDGSRKYVWMQTDDLWLSAPTCPDVLATYRVGLWMFQDITSTQYVSAPWIPSRSETPVQVLEYDHLKQVYRLEVRQPRTVQWPADYTFEENDQRILDSLPQNVRPHCMIGAKPVDMRQFGELREECDLCLSQCTVSCRSLIFLIEIV